MNNLLVADSISKNFGDFKALNEVSIAVPEGSIFGLLGPNGAGKTTLIRIINQITMPDTGQVLLDGLPLKPENVRDIGYLPEERGLYKSMKVGEQVLYLAQLKGLSKQEAKKRLKYWFDKLEIGDWWNKKIQELIKDEILQLRDEGATVIFSTHRMESVEELCDQIALIHKSNKILDGKLTDIKRQFKTNTFEVGLQSSNPEEVTRQIKEKFEVFPATFRNLNNDVKINIKLPQETSSNDLLSFLTSKAEIHHFVEVVPSVNDIFIQTVKNN